MNPNETNHFHLDVSKHTEFCYDSHTKDIFSKWSYPKEWFLVVIIRFQNNWFVLIAQVSTINTLLVYAEESYSHPSATFHCKRKLSQSGNGQVTLKNSYNHKSFYFRYQKGAVYRLETLDGFSFYLMQEGSGPRQKKSVLSFKLISYGWRFS